MDGFDALLREMKRVFAPGSVEAPFVWLLAAALLALLAYLVRRLSKKRPNEIEHLFLASAASTRSAREVAEIDAFARRASASAEDLKTRIRRLRTGHFQQVKIYIDHSNFIRTWTQVVHNRDRPLEHDVDWSKLPHVITDDTARWLAKSSKVPQALVYRGTNVYGTLFDESYFKLLETMLRLEKAAPDKLPLPIRLRAETVERWREENEAHKVELTQAIQNEIGYTMVPIFRRTPREDQLFSANFTSGGIPIAPEKMLDTHMAVDLIGDATFDVYDIAVIISEDSDFVPAVDFVQEMRHKHVIHVGFGGYMNDLRAKCRHRIDLGKDGAFRRMQRAKSGSADEAAKPASPIGRRSSGGGRG
jgi:uncharacterized LabA/DUF88 family protein